MAMLLPEAEGAARTAFSAFDLAFARRLAHAVNERTGMTRPFKLGNWADHFAKLRELDGIRRRRVERVLDWYCRHIGERYVPLAFCARSFRAKFARIELAMERIGD